MSYASSTKCAIVDREGGIAVETHVVSWEIIDGGIVQGGLESGVTFKLDTNTGVTKYSNGEVGVPSDHGYSIKTEELGNGYEIHRLGWQPEIFFILKAGELINFGVFDIGEHHLADWRVDGQFVRGSLMGGQTFWLDTSTDQFKLNELAEDEKRGRRP